MDNLSSAHVYLRLSAGDSWTSIPQALLEDCAQLTKANSIEGKWELGKFRSVYATILFDFDSQRQGNKKDNITVIYTPWSNLRKDASMATGQVSFHDPKMVKKVHVAVRENAIVNRLNKTRVEKFPDLRAEKESDQREKRKVERIAREQQKARDREERKQREELRWQKDHAYDDVMREENMVSNQDRDAGFHEDDFM